MSRTSTDAKAFLTRFFFATNELNTTTNATNIRRIANRKKTALGKDKRKRQLFFVLTYLAQEGKKKKWEVRRIVRSHRAHAWIG